MKQIIYLFLLFPLAIYGQRTKDIVALRVGYGSTNIVFKEAYEHSINFFGRILKSGKAYTGQGWEFGISKDLTENLFMEASFSSFSDRRTTVIVNNYESYYTIKGSKVPLTLNYLLRNSTKRFRINIGAGAQYLKAYLQQYGTINNDSGSITNQLTDIKISEFQVALRPGVQFRIIPTLYASFIVTIGILTNRRYTDNPCVSLKYSFKTKKWMTGT